VMTVALAGVHVARTVTRRATRSGPPSGS
jgi:cob(I)alamin adenosyltransferase